MAKGYMNRGGYGGGRPSGMMNMNMMKQVQKMQEDMAKMQEELAAKTYSAVAGGGVVTAVVNGERKLSQLTIDPSCVDPEDVEMLEDLITVAVNEALAEQEEDAQGSMKNITGSMNLGL